VAAGIHKQRVLIEPRALERMRRMRQETNPSLLSVSPHFEIVQE
jgi:hypothetical protein